MILPSRPAMPGLLDPRQTYDITINPPLGPGEQAVLLTAHPGAVVMKAAEGPLVRIENLTDDPVVYLLLVVPTYLVKAASTDWGRLWADARLAMGTPEGQAEGLNALKTAAGNLLRNLLQQVRKP